MPFAVGILPIESLQLTSRTREIGRKVSQHPATLDYDPYGRRTKVSGSYDADFGYTGHFHEQPGWMSTGLNLAMFRAYDPELGRWLTRDPIEEMTEPNLYEYVKGNPIKFIDPLGQYSLDPDPPPPHGPEWRGPFGCLGMELWECVIFCDKRGSRVKSCNTYLRYLATVGTIDYYDKHTICKCFKKRCRPGDGSGPGGGPHRHRPGDP